jgi:predicted methyltransferase
VEALTVEEANSLKEMVSLPLSLAEGVAYLWRTESVLEEWLEVQRALEVSLDVVIVDN